MQTSPDWEHLGGRAGREGISFSLLAAAGSLRLCLCHQTPACPKHDGEAGMEDMSTSLPPPSVGMASADLRETASQHVCDSRIWGLLEELHLTILGHADLRLGEDTKLYICPCPAETGKPPRQSQIPQVTRGKTWLLTCSVFGKETQFTLYSPSEAVSHEPMQQGEGGHPSTHTLHSNSQLHPGTTASGARKHCKLESK